MRLIIALFTILFFASQANASDWTLPVDFSTNFVDYPAANSLPEITTPGAITTACIIKTAGSYYLANDIYARGEGVVIEANGVTLDLNGHKIVYSGDALDRAYGVSLPNSYEALTYFPRGHYGPNDNFTLTDTIGGGKIIKATNMARYCSGLLSYANSGLVVSNVYFDHSGIDASGIELFYARGVISITGVTTQYQYVRDSTPIIDPALLAYPPDNVSTFYWVSNRSSVVVGGIKNVMAHVDLVSMTISGNTILSTPQQGIYLDDQTALTGVPTTRDSGFFDNLSGYSYRYIVANNNITMTSKATNGYGILQAATKVHSYGNTITGYGRGIAVGAEYQWIHDNSINISEGSNFEYQTNFVKSQGMKFEGSGGVNASQTMTEDNTVIVTSRGVGDYVDTDFWYIPGTPNTYFGDDGTATALNMTPAGDTYNEIRNNTFRAIMPTDVTVKAHSLFLVGLMNETADISNMGVVSGNTFESNGYYFATDYDADQFDWRGLTIDGNTYVDLNIYGHNASLFYYSHPGDLPYPFAIKDPASATAAEYRDNPNYLIGSSASDFNIVFQERFCGETTDTLTITSPQLGTIYNGTLGATDKTLDIIYRAIEKLPGGTITDVTPTYSLSFTTGGETYTNSNWVPDLTDEYCGAPPAAGGPASLNGPTGASLAGPQNLSIQ